MWYEYKIIAVRLGEVVELDGSGFIIEGSSRPLQPQLDELGRERWELTHVIDNFVDQRFYFKRDCLGITLNEKANY